MKKLISLLLVLVLSLGLLSGIALADDPAFEEPTETTQADAAVKVTSSSDAAAAYYFDALDQNVLAWVCLNVEGKKTITLQKDLELTGAIEGFNYLLKVPNDLASWAGRSGEKYPLVIDLGGKTITYTGSANLFYLERFGFTLKNGTIIYKSDSADNAVIALSTPHFRTAYTNGTTAWTPKLNLEEVQIYNTSEQGGPVILNYEYSPQITISDSTVWTAAGSAINLQKTAQDAMGEGDLPYEGDYLPLISLDSSTLGSGSGMPLTAVESGTVMEIMDSTIVTNAESGLIMDESNPVELDSKGMDAMENAVWTADASVGQLKGKAFLYGDAALLPFTDVIEGEWYYEFVTELYYKGVVNGMTADTFAPNATLTYGQALKLITLGIGEAEQATSGTHWASGYLKLAQDKGWITGDVDLDGPISRLSFCQIAAKAKNLTEQPAANPFTDCADEAVLALNKAGVINGMTATTFGPDMTLTRAQISKIISLLSKL